MELLVNGGRHDVRLPDATPLLTALRENLNLKGARFGCGEERCGSCVVLINGVPQHSCRISIEAVQGQEITTIEALCEDETGRMVIAEFLQEQAAQCGYCINGLLVSLTGLLKSNPARSRDEVIKFLDERHLCRCGAHPRILRVIARLFPAQVQNGTA